MRELSNGSSAQGPTIAEILSALSHALDLTEGQPQGHAIRTAAIARRIATEMSLPHADETRLFYGALLKDSGCSTNAARIQAAFGGDELESKRDVKFVDWSIFLHSAIYAMSHAERGGTPMQRLRKMLELAKTPPTVMDEVTLARCTRGADIARRLGFDGPTSNAVRCVDEHWDGRGSPAKLKGDAIPLLARILCAAQTFELFATEFGRVEAYHMLAKRSGKWFDPQIVRALEAFREDAAFWKRQAAMNGSGEISADAPDDAGAATDAGIDDVCVAFASIVDAKSGFTAEHSHRVTGYATALGTYLELSSDRLRTLRRAALLHDIGKLGVSNAILDKPGKLDASEWQHVQKHPRFTLEILGKIRGFSEIAAIGAAHHERLDGRGYHLGLTAEQLNLEMRILAAADVFDALTADRPYREAMTPEAALKIMDKDAGISLDATCVDALTRHLRRRS